MNNEANSICAVLDKNKYRITVASF